MVVQAQTAQIVYRSSESDACMADLLGGKAGNLCEMTRLGLPVPPGFVITTQVCRDYLAGDYMLPDGLADTLRQYNMSQPSGPHLNGKQVSLVGSILSVKRRGYSFWFPV